MKKIVLLAIIICALFACDKETEVLDVSISNENISFTAIPGGSVLDYTLPDDENIFVIQAKYKDRFGNDQIVKGTYLNSSIKLGGFIEEESDIPVEVSLMGTDGSVSKSINTSFSVLESATLTFFRNVEVSTYWYGFKLKYEVPDVTQGFLHVGKIDTNPYTGKLDTLLIETKTILPGKNELTYTNHANSENMTDVVLWTEDFKGNKVKKQVFDNVIATTDIKIDPRPEDQPLLHFSLDGSFEENDNWSVGPDYLFDGDTKGIGRLEDSHAFKSFVSRKDAVPGDWILDLKEEKTVSRMFFYSPVGRMPKVYYNWYHVSLLPNDITVYASNNKDASPEEWVELGSYYEPASNPIASRWCSALEPYLKVESRDKIERADPIYLELTFDVSEDKYRYYKIHVEEVFRGKTADGEIGNPENRFMIQELEVYEKQ